MTDQLPSSDSKQFDAAEFQQQTQEMLNNKMDELKESLVSGLGGKQSRYGETGPQSWDQLQDDTVNIAVEKAVKKTRAEVMSEIEAREKKKAEELNQAAAATQEERRREWAQITEDWKEAVKDGHIPDIDPSIKEKLKTGTQPSQLTEEEQQDPGLQAYQQSFAQFAQFKKEGKGRSFYRFVSQVFGKQPAGASAPVMGGSTALPQKSEEYDYNEIAANRRKRFGF